MTGNDVTYEYGTSGNDKGRLVFVTDGSGSYECHYDALGNVTDEIRTISLPQNNTEVYRFKMSYQYDSWGRMHTMTYPDGEVVKYSYIWGGDLYSMQGNNPYINKIFYNHFGQRARVDYGNNTYAKYTYDALHRLTCLESHEAGGNLMQKIDYDFDQASNITAAVNNVLPFGPFDGHYKNGYNYDALNRLEHSDGTNTLGFYEINMRYSDAGRIAQKDYNTPASSPTQSMDMHYAYCNNYQPHAVRRIYDKKNEMHYDFRWDEAGNLGQISVAPRENYFKHGRFLFWTEDSRMHAAINEKFYSYYTYDHSGERRLKLVGDNSSMDVNADAMYTATVLDNPTLYPSAYVVLGKKEYTKHYYAGTDRVAACLGGGHLDVIQSQSNWDGTGKPPAYMQEVSDRLFKESLKQVYERVLMKNDPDCITEIYEYVDGLHHPIDGIPERVKAEVAVELKDFRNNVRDMRGYLHDERKNVYYYHSDHLGSASWITNHNGNAVQHLQYLPYGEPYVNIRTTGYSERFTFTGKERDEETGYGYFGARYMDHELMTMWLSVDPMADKYPSISPYAYCAWNPVRLVDPDGRELTDFKDKKGNLIKHIEDGQNVSYVIKGTGAHEHFEYESGNINAENIDYQTEVVVQEQQSYNMKNPDLKEKIDSKGNSTTFCNYAAQNIQEAVGSIPGNNNVLTTGKANDMAKAMAKSDNYISVTQQEAFSYADQGYLVISSWINPSGSHGHVATLSVGSNREVGSEYANIGPAEYSGFKTYGATYGKPKQPYVKHYVYMRSSCKPVNIIASKPN